MSSRATFFAILFRRVRPDNVANLRCKLSLLRPRDERPRRRRAAEQRDELAAPHSITSSGIRHSLGADRLVKCHLGVALKVVICAITGFQSACSVRIYASNSAG